jgi:hypothetical protein
MKKIKAEISGAIILMAIIITIFTLIDFVRFPECYVPSWRDGLKREIDAGNEKYIEFYNEHYVEQGRPLFEEGEI